MPDAAPGGAALPSEGPASPPRASGWQSGVTGRAATSRSPPQGPPAPARYCSMNECYFAAAALPDASRIALCRPPPPPTPPPQRHIRGARFASAITMDANGVLRVPNDPIIPYLEGDGTGKDIWTSAVRVFDAAVDKAYGGKRKITVSDRHSPSPPPPPPLPTPPPPTHPPPTASVTSHRQQRTRAASPLHRTGATATAEAAGARATMGAASREPSVGNAPRPPAYSAPDTSPRPPLPRFPPARAPSLSPASSRSGTRPLPARRRSRRRGSGSPRRRWRTFGSTSSGSRAPSRRPSAAGSGPSTSRCGRSSTCTCASGPSGILRASRRPSSARRTST
jgi:hypothetical protein